YTATVTVSDDDGGSDIRTVDLIVANIAPTIHAGNDRVTDEGAVVSLSNASFHDAGTADRHTAKIDWGDGTPVQPGDVSESPFGPPGLPSGASGSIAGSHAYADSGPYTVTVTVVDDDGATNSDTLLITVN